MKLILRLLVAVFLCLTKLPAKAETCALIGYNLFRPNVMVSEHDSFARVWLRRTNDTALAQSVDYFTVDGLGGNSAAPHVARAGVDYVVRSGTATFAVGEITTGIDVPLIDNPLLEGYRDFSVLLTNGAPGLALEGISLEFVSGPGSTTRGSVSVRIQDNELHSTVDPLFVPDIGWWGNPFAMPDGRLLLPGLTMLRADGSFDVAFATNIAASVGSGWLNPVRVLSDGRIFAAHSINGQEPRLVRLWPGGALDAVFAVTNFIGGLENLRAATNSTVLAAVLPDAGVLTLSAINDNLAVFRRFLPDGSPDQTGGFTITDFADFAVPQPNGKLLVFTRNGNFYGTTLSRRNADGSPDTGFTSPAITASTIVHGERQFALRDDGKIVILREFLISGRWELQRLNADGSRDESFTPPPFHVSEFFLRGNGKAIVKTVQRGAEIVKQINEDGSLDSSFTLEPVPDFNFGVGSFQELPDGRLLAVPYLQFQNTVIRWNVDGTSDGNFAPDILGGYYVCAGPPSLTLHVAAGRAFLAGPGVASVDGFPGPGWRLLGDPPERDFRVVTPAAFYRSSGVARIRVARTGSTEMAASVSFTTRGDTAKDSEDFLFQSGTLNFAPFEVVKEVAVPLLDRPGAEERLYFQMELANPSADYATIASTPIAILPDLRMATDSLRSRGEDLLTVNLRGTVPGRYYTLEVSTDLKNWEGLASVLATGSTVEFDDLTHLSRRSSPQFFRAR